MNRLRLLLPLVLIAGALAAPGAAQAASACPAFTVVHNDRIGALVLPHGKYTLRPRGLSCAAAATNFANFLQYPAGLLPSPWRVVASQRLFTTGRGQSFTVSGSNPNPPNPPNPPRPGRCSGTFQVVHNDRIGALQLPKGPYFINVSGGLSCSQAYSLFPGFLQDWDGNLPSPWRVVASQRRFNGGARGSFVVTRAGGGGGGGGGGNGQRLCPGTFRVLNNDRIGALSIPRGSYFVHLLPSRSLTCAVAYSQFSNFLSRPSGRLPAPWFLDPTTGTFLRGQTNPATGFRIDRGSSTGGTTPP